VKRVVGKRGDALWGSSIPHSGREVGREESRNQGKRLGEGHGRPNPRVQEIEQEPNGGKSSGSLKTEKAKDLKEPGETPNWSEGLTGRGNLGETKTDTVYEKQRGRADPLMSILKKRETSNSSAAKGGGRCSTLIGLPS